MDEYKWLTKEDIGELSLIEVEGELFRRDFRKFIRESWHVIDSDVYRHNWHIDALAEHLQWVALGEIQRLMIMMPPRMGKSIITGVNFPAYLWTIDPGLKMITGSYDLSLAIRDARKARQLIMSPWYQRRFVDTLPERERWTLVDSFTRRRQDFYTNSMNGHRVAVSTDGKTTGEGGSLMIIDDPLNAKAAIKSKVERKNAIEWYNWAARSRLNNQNEDSIIVNAQRVHEDDLQGHLLKEEGSVTSGGRWVVLELPNEYNPRRKCIVEVPGLGKTFEDPRTEEGELLNPTRLGAVATKELKRAMGREYTAQYQQNPASDDGLILKRSYWGRWEWPEWHPERNQPRPLPQVHTIVAVVDTAFEASEDDDESACTVWGLFEHHEEEINPRTGKAGVSTYRQCAILLGAWRDHLEFPELREKVRATHEKFDCDLVLVEKKSSGHSLLHELRNAGLPVRGVKLGVRDKVERARIASLPLADGRIFYLPDRPWAEDVVDMCAKFPMADLKDIVDTCVIAWAWMRARSIVGTADTDEDGDASPFDEIERAANRERPIYG
jgi:predicted phage terminase large subunit-like protein